MDSFDDIKKKLNIEEMDKESRSDMFNKFVDGGGKVIKDKGNTVKFNREKQLSIKKQIEKSRYKQKMLAEKAKQQIDKTKQNQNVLNSMLKGKQGKQLKRYFSIFLLGFLQGIFTLSGRFKSKFSREVQDDLINILRDLKRGVEKLINLYPEKKWQAIDIINSSDNYGFEIIVRIHNIFKPENFTRVANYFNLYSNILCPQIINDLLILFKKLLILYPYWETTKDILLKSQQVYQSLTTLDPLLSKSKINKSIDKLFSYYFPRILTIINYNLGQKIKFDYEKMYNFTKINTEIDIGSYTKDLAEMKKEYFLLLEREKEERMKKLQEEVEKKEMEKMPKYVQKGLIIIDAVIESIPKKANDDENALLFEQNEKMMEFYFLFKEFDMEYSFIMTTSQIKINTTIESGIRTDIKSEFDNLYIRFNEINSFVKEYLKLQEQHFKIKNEMKNSAYVIQQKLSNFKIKRTQTFNEIRTRSSVFFKKFAITLQKLIEDFNKEKHFLQSGDKNLHFQMDLGDKRKFEGVSIINAILITFSFTSALHYYVTSGRLSGKGLFFHEDEKGKSNDSEKSSNVTQQKNSTKKSED